MKDPTIINDNYTSIEAKNPIHARVENTDLVIIKYDNKVSVLYGRCLHRGASNG